MKQTQRANLKKKNFLLELRPFVSIIARHSAFRQYCWVPVLSLGHRLLCAFSCFFFLSGDRYLGGCNATDRRKIFHDGRAIFRACFLSLLLVATSAGLYICETKTGSENLRAMVF